MPAYLNFAAYGTARNGTTAHTVDPSSSTDLIAGTPFTPTAGTRLVVIAHGSVTSTTPTGWTLPTGGSAVNNTGLYVWHRVAAGADTFTTTHNASNYPVAFAVFEFPASSTFVASVASTSVTSTGANPNLTGLTGTTQVFGVKANSDATAVGPFTGTWTGPTVEILDTDVAESPTDGYWLHVGYIENYASSSYQPTSTRAASAGLPNTCECLTFALTVPAGGADPVPPFLIMAPMG